MQETVREGDLGAEISAETVLPGLGRGIVSDRTKDLFADKLGKLANPFRPQMRSYWQEANPSLFRGREAAVRELQREVEGNGENALLYLLAPRGCGKSSFLHFLPRQMPPTIPCVNFDTQGNAVSTPRKFFRSITPPICLALKAVGISRQPLYTEEGDGDVDDQMVCDWFQDVAQALAQVGNDHRLLICIDEYERLDGVYQERLNELLRILRVIQSSVSHQRHVRWLLAGLHRPQDSGAHWTSLFQGNHEQHLGFLPEEEAKQLLRTPSIDFPDTAIGDDVASAIVAATGGHPYFLQLYGEMLIDYLNREGRRTASLEDLDAVEKELFQSAFGTFFELGKALIECGCDDESLEKLLAGQKMAMDESVASFLSSYGILNNQQCLAIPLLARWIEECYGVPSLRAEIESIPSR